MPPPPAGSPNVGQVTSAALFGSLFNFLLFGMLLIQVCVYKVCFPQDRRAVKAVVYAVFLMMLLSVCFNASDAHFWYAAHFGDLITFGEARLSAFYTPIIGSLIALAVQLFFCYRISMFRQAVWVAGVIALVRLPFSETNKGNKYRAWNAHRYPSHKSEVELARVSASTYPRKRQKGGRTPSSPLFAPPFFMYVFIVIRSHPALNLASFQPSCGSRPPPSRTCSSQLP
ncbi:hypothetical protein B0H17DRAFT_1296047 [Mycena rosella]|uniref:Uncharacterized protein n=1 Tax=Mycena rosella TaxID=1033263 RepID=A0AAD7GG13_MYCRO|nr:hypothetical protein B0H17DRAFT_1296047 [Mycena rosella]